MATSPDDPAVPKVLHIPDTLASWPWPRATNPHYEEVKAIADAWFHSFNTLTPKSQSAFKGYDPSHLAALVYPWVSKEHLRTGCDLLNLMFLIDEYTDVESGPAVRQIVDVIIDSVKNPHKPRPEGETPLGEVTRQFWSLAIKTATQTAQNHMTDAFTDYLNSVVEEAQDRDTKKTYHTVDQYLEGRRRNGGTYLALVPMELDLNMTDDVFYHPTLVELSRCCVELILLDNDILSYNKEQATGDDNQNILPVTMRQFDMDLNSAMTWVVNYHREIQLKFLEALKHLPRFGLVIDEQVQRYVYGLANWVRGNRCWSFEATRYFGNRGLEYQKEGQVPLFPKVRNLKHNAPLELRGGNLVVPLVEGDQVVESGKGV